MAQASKVTFLLYLSTGQLIKKRYDFVHINKHCGLEGEKKIIWNMASHLDNSIREKNIVTDW